MLEFLIRHWRGLGIGGGSLALIGLIAAVILNPVAVLSLVKSVGGFVLDKAKALVEWARKPHDWWRIGCLSMACVCAYLAVLTGNARKERDDAVQQLASVQTTIQTVREQGAANVQAAQAQCRADNAEAVAKAQAHARDVESKLAAAMTELAAKNAREKADAKRNGDDLAAGVRAGTVQLRDQWQNRAFNVPGLAGGAGGQDDAADLRATGVGRVREIGASCDAEIRYWQGVWKAAGAVK